MSPLFPRLSAVKPRAPMNCHTFVASAATARPAPVAANERMISGLRPNRSASAAPEREEQQADDVRADGDRSDPERDLLGRHADAREVERGERGQLPVRDDLHEAREGEEHEHPAPAGPSHHGEPTDCRTRDAGE